MTVSSLQYPAQGWAMKLSLSSSCQPLFLTLTWPTPVSVLKQNIFMSTHCISAQTKVNLAQTTWQGPHGVSKHPGALAAGPAAGRLSCRAPPAAPLPRPCGCSGPSGSSLGCSLSITSALCSAGPWLQGFTPHFKSSQLSCRFHGSFLTRPGFDVCFP